MYSRNELTVCERKRAELQSITALELQVYFWPSFPIAVRMTCEAAEARQGKLKQRLEVLSECEVYVY